MTTQSQPSAAADRSAWRKPAAAALAVLMLLIGPAAVGMATPTEPGWPSSPPTEQPVPPADHPGSDQLAPSGIGCPPPHTAAFDPDPVDICAPAGPAATPNPATSTTTATTAPTSAVTTAGPMVL